MTAPGRGSVSVGIRPVSLERRRVRPIYWALPGDLDLALGDRVSVQTPGDEWLGEVVVPPDLLIEVPDTFATGQVPIVMRRANEDEWPDPPETEGRRLLDSLGLPPDAMGRSGGASAS